MRGETVEVLLADDHPAFRAGVRYILTGKNELVVVGEAEEGGKTLHLCRELNPDVLVLDLNMPGLPVVEVISAVQRDCPKTKILILSGYADEIKLKTLMDLGIAGYVLKGEEIEMLLRAIATVAEGGKWFSQKVLEKIIPPWDEAAVGFSTLTKRERQVLELLAQGWDNAGIAKELSLAKQTVHNYVSQIYEKLGVNTRSEAIVLTREHWLGKE
jgi:DNA-binding NarL/FixJ family response regulator